MKKKEKCNNALLFEKRRYPTAQRQGYASTTWSVNACYHRSDSWKLVKFVSVSNVRLTIMPSACLRTGCSRLGIILHSCHYVFKLTGKCSWAFTINLSRRSNRTHSSREAWHRNETGESLDIGFLLTARLSLVVRSNWQGSEVSLSAPGTNIRMSTATKLGKPARIHFFILIRGRVSANLENILNDTYWQCEITEPIC